MSFSKGDAIEIVCDDRTVDGRIEMISENQRSAVIRFDAMLHGHVRLMPISLIDAQHGVYCSIIDGTEITVRGKPSS